MKLNLFAKTALTIVGLFTIGAPKSQAQAPGNQPYFMIVNQNSGKCLDLIGGSTANGAVTNQWTYDYNGPNQRWALLPTEGGNHFKLISWVSGKAVSVANNSLTSGAQLWAWDYNSDTSQQWDLVDAGNGWYNIKNVRSGLLMDVSGSSTADNAKIQQYSNTNSAAQRFRLQPWGSYYLRASTGKYVCVQGAGSTNGSPIIQYTQENNPWFKWNFTSEGDGFYGLFSLNAPTRTISVVNSSVAAAANTQLWDYNVNNVGDQKVRIVPKTNGKFKFYWKHDGMTWDIPGGNAANNVNLQQYPDNGNSWQEFGMERGDVAIGGGGGANSIYSVPVSSIPTPVGTGSVSLRVMNGTNGVYPDTQVYWGIIGQNPANGNKWSYLDLNGNLQPISLALNDASGHLVKGGVNYANIYHTVSQQQWVNLPKITAARMFLSVGSPCYIKTFDNGFAGPDINNSADPNANVYFDFTEFTLDQYGYHGNVTRVDMFGFPVQHRVVNMAGDFDQTVGELESETRSGIFSEYQNEVPNEFKSLGTVQAPYRIVAPNHGSFAAGQPNGNYFASYSSVSTQDILLGVGGAADPATCAALNRHVYTNPQSTWGNVASYYQAAPANYYAKFWHVHAISGLAYGFPYDDVNNQAAYLTPTNPKGIIFRVGW